MSRLIIATIAALVLTLAAPVFAHYLAGNDAEPVSRKAKVGKVDKGKVAKGKVDKGKVDKGKVGKGKVGKGKVTKGKVVRGRVEHKVERRRR